MLEFLRGWIINIVTISIILILFEIIVPSGKIKKIINLVSGFILLIAVINPFLTLKNKGFDLGENVLADSYNIDKNEVETSNKVFQDNQMKQISAIYKKKLINTIKEETDKLDGVSDSSVNVVINEDYSSDKFGEIKKVYLQIKKGKKKNDKVKINSVEAIEKVDISAKPQSDKKTQALTAIDPETQQITQQIKQSLYKTLQIDKDSIVVSVN
jgi:stage III sporulation protein AF